METRRGPTPRLRITARAARGAPAARSASARSLNRRSESQEKIQDCAFRLLRAARRSGAAQSQKQRRSAKQRENKGGQKPILQNRLLTPFFAPFLLGVYLRFLGRPTGRDEGAIPSRVAVRDCHGAEPYGVPRSMLRLIAATSFSFCGVFTRRNQSEGQSTGHSSSRVSIRPVPSRRTNKLHHRHRSAASTRFAVNAFRSTYRATCK